MKHLYSEEYLLPNQLLKVKCIVKDAVKICKYRLSREPLVFSFSCFLPLPPDFLKPLK